MTDAERAGALSAIASEVAICTRCRLHATRTRAVPGEGSPDTEVVFVGEGPGFNEDRQGRPFVGAAGSFLGELLASVGWQREDVFITNVVKCRPPENRDPEPDEIAACAPYLARQLAALDPALVVTLGRHSMARFMPGARIGQVHGTSRPADPAVGAADAHVFAMYHPAAALHQGALRQTLLDDMLRVPAALLASREERAAHDRATAASSELEPASGPAARPAEADATTAETTPALNEPSAPQPAAGETQSGTTQADAPQAMSPLPAGGPPPGPAVDIRDGVPADGPTDRPSVGPPADVAAATPGVPAAPIAAANPNAPATPIAPPDAEAGDPASQLTLF